MAKKSFGRATHRPRKTPLFPSFVVARYVFVAVLYRALLCGAPWPGNVASWHGMARHVSGHVCVIYVVHESVCKGGWLLYSISHSC